MHPRRGVPGGHGLLKEYTERRRSEQKNRYGGEACISEGALLHVEMRGGEIRADLGKL